MTLHPFTKSAPIAETIIGMSSSLNEAVEFMLRPQLLIRSQTTYMGTLSTSTENRTYPSTQEIISLLRGDGLPLAAIANIAKVERKTVYSWIDGGPIRLENQQRLETLHDLLITNRQAPLLYLYRYWNQKTQEGHSLNNLLSEKKINITAAKQALLELWPIARKYQIDLRQSYQEANEDEEQNRSMSDWDVTLTDGSDEW